jgi:hypothetical protein
LGGRLGLATRGSPKGDRIRRRVGHGWRVHRRSSSSNTGRANQCHRCHRCHRCEWCCLGVILGDGCTRKGRDPRGCRTGGP